MPENPHRETLLGLIKASGLTRNEVAGLLHQTPAAVNAWLRPDTSAAMRPAPKWACELLAFKAGLPIPRFEKESHPA